MDWLGIVIVFLVAPLPIVEVRLSVVLGLTFYHLGVPLTFALTVLSNLLFILILWPQLPRLERLFRRSATLGRWLDWLLARYRREVTPGKQRLEGLGLFTIVALVGVPIPLPGSGLYTALGAAYIFGMPLKKTLVWLMAGVFVATTVIVLLVQAGRIVHSI